VVIIYNKIGQINYTIENEYTFDETNLTENQNLLITDNEKIKTNTHYIENNAPVLKKDLNLRVNSKKINAGSTIKLTLESEIPNTEIKMKINDIEFTVIIENNQGSKEIELQEPDIYQISCIDHRLISQPVRVEVV
jgi:hypothetical protein